MADEVTTAAVPAAPLSVNDILADLKGFGIEDFEDVITMKSGTKQVQLKIANIPTEEERVALLAVEEFKGYAWLQEIKCEILSRSVSWINGINIRALAPEQRRVVDPIDGQQKDIQVVLRGIIKGWGQEFMQCLWKVLMVHSQTIEDRLMESFPDAAVMTEVERRLTERARVEIEAATQSVIEEQVSALFADEEKPVTE
jgi:hypothetical protein